MNTIEKTVRIQKIPFDQLSNDEKELFQQALIEDLLPFRFGPENLGISYK